MTISELHLSFKVLLDKSDIVGYPSFLPEEIDFFLNKAVREFVKTRYSGNNFSYKGFQQNEKRDADLTNTLSIYKVVPTVIKSSYEYSVEVPQNIWFIVGEQVTLSSNGTDGRGIEVVTDVLETTVDTFNAEKTNYLSDMVKGRDGLARPLRLRIGDTIKLYSDGYHIMYYEMIYIKEPDVINHNYPSANYKYISSEAHDEIVSLAVRMALENVSEPRYQSYTVETSRME